MAITDQQILDLSIEAAQSGDTEMVIVCAAALAGDKTARVECEQVIADAQSRLDGCTCKGLRGSHAASCPWTMLYRGKD